MVTLLLTRILVDGGILTTVVSIILVGMLYFKPRLALADYPPDVRAAVPPRTKQELQLGIILTIPMLVLLVFVPFYSVWLAKQANGQVLTYGMAFVIIFGEYFLFSMFDLIVLDIFMFYSWTPKFLILPGTAGFAGYKNWKPHVKAQLTQGNLIILIVSALLALIPYFVY